MINPYFTLISAVRLSAQLRGQGLYDNYAFHGALGRFADLDLGEIGEADGIEDVHEKAKSFVLGQKCGRALKKHLTGYEGEKMLYCEALVAGELLMKLTPGTTAKYMPDELEKNITLIFKSLVKRAQIRTHTAKPGGEDIHAWLSSYYSLEKEYEHSLAALVKVIVHPDASLKAKYATGFFSKDDPIISLALRADSPSVGELEGVMAKEPETVFGRILKDSIPK